VHICKWQKGFNFKSFKKLEVKAESQQTSSHGLSHTHEEPKKKSKKTACSHDADETQNLDYHIFSFTFEQDGDQIFSVSFPDKVMFHEKINYKYSSCRLIIVKSNNDYDLTDGVSYIGGLYEHWERDYYIERTSLPKGKYYVFVEIDWHESVDDNQRMFNVTCYGAGRLIIDDQSQVYKKEFFLKKAFIAKLKYSRSGLGRITMKEKKAPLIKRYLEQNFPEGYNYVIILNQESEAVYKESQVFDKFDKIELCAPHKGNKYSIAVGPFQDEIVLMKAHRGSNFQPGIGKKQVMLGDTKLRQMALENEFKVTRQDTP